MKQPGSPSSKGSPASPETGRRARLTDEQTGREQPGSQGAGGTAPDPGVECRVVPTGAPSRAAIWHSRPTSPLPTRAGAGLRDPTGPGSGNDVVFPRQRSVRDLRPEILLCVKRAARPRRPRPGPRSRAVAPAASRGPRPPPRRPRAPPEALRLSPPATGSREARRLGRPRGQTPDPVPAKRFLAQDPLDDAPGK